MRRPSLPTVRHRLRLRRPGWLTRSCFALRFCCRGHGRVRSLADFDEILLHSKPQVDALYRASNQLANSAPFNKLLEIILAFGNYMNSAKRGSAYGIAGLS